jgi:hypothetical protein
MLVIVASRWDKAARTFASRRSSEKIGILTPRDLSVAGWRQRPDSPAGSSVVVEGRVVDQSEITGVLTLLPCVSERELTHIAPGDRRFVASEMTAFLLFWLSILKCPVLNRPTPACLSGPSWRWEYWVHTAAQAGIPVRPLRRISFPATPGSEKERDVTPTIVTVVGTHTFGEAAPELHRHARCLAGATGVEFLSVQFSGPADDAELIGADLFGNLTDDSLAEAVMEYLRG